MKKNYIFLIAYAITTLGFGQTNSDNFHLRLHANIGTSTYHTDFYFNDNSTLGVDRGYDAAIFGNTAPSTAIYSQLVEGYPNIDFTIQSLPIWVLGSEVVVSLGINVPQGQQVTVSIWESDLPSDIEVYLEDIIDNTYTLLNNSNYVFIPSNTLSDTGRFFLRFTQETLSSPESNNDALQIYTTTSQRQLFIKGLLQEKTSVSIYDVQGRNVLSSVLESSTHSNQIDVSFLNSGVYVVKLNNSTQQKNQKIILR